MNVRADRADRGAVLVEFAIVVPVMILLLFGIIEFGRAYNTVISLQGAAREGVRVLALADLDANEDTAVEVEDAVRGWANIPVDSIKQTNCTELGGQARVEAIRNFRLGIPFVPSATLTLKGDASMRCGL